MGRSCPRGAGDCFLLIKTEYGWDLRESAKPFSRKTCAGLKVLFAKAHWSSRHILPYSTWRPKNVSRRSTWNHLACTRSLESSQHEAGLRPRSQPLLCAAPQQHDLDCLKHNKNIEPD